MHSIVRTGAGAALAAILVSVPVTARAQGSGGDVKKEIEGLKQGQQEILKQLEELKKMMQARQAPAQPSGPNVKDVVFNLGNNPIKGQNAAKITLVEFTDYQ